ncbi:MAG: tetratricopeptide repeat protein [Gammaproteobacteria bacterium]|nr:tetratricopeptide repeat protein [Gammaproteobacteria bacterium]
MRNEQHIKLLCRLAGFVLPGIVALMVAACARTNVSSVTADEPGIVVEDTDERVKITRVEPVRPKIPLTEDLLFKLLMAEIAGHRGLLDVAVDNYLDLARTTRDHRIVERAARIAVYARNDAAALAAAGLWVELDPRNPDPHQVLAVMKLRSGDLEQAASHLQDIFAYSEGEVDQKLWMIANLLGSEKDKDAVLDVMEQLVASQNNSADAMYAFAHVAAKLEDLQRSRELLEDTLALAPDNINVALSYISILQRMGREQEALAWLEAELPRHEGNDFNLRMAYARLLMEFRLYDKALDQFELLAAREPENTDVLYALGLLYLQNNRLDDSEALFRKLSVQEYLTDTANYYLGRIAEEKRLYDEAGDWYQGVYKGEHYFDAQIRLAMLLARKGEVNEARAHLGTIRAQSEQQQRLIIQAEGELLLEAERYEEAVAVYSAALEDQYDADLLYARAMAAEKAGNLELLEADLRTILRHEPDHAQALNALGYTLADATDRHAEAYELIKKALELRPTDFYILDSMGWVLYRLGRLDEAIDYLRKALNIRQDPEIAAHLGEVLWVRGEREQAKEVWEAALRQTPEDTRLLDVIERFAP